jgi:hypothetical protein
MTDFSQILKFLNKFKDFLTSNFILVFDLNKGYFPWSQVPVILAEWVSLLLMSNSI